MPAILRRFQRSVSTCFVIEFGDLYCRFFTNSVQVESAGSPYEIVSVYMEADLAGLQFVQVNDVIYITHASYPVYKLTRITDTNWTLEAVEFAQPMFLDENLDNASTLRPSATTGNITILASPDVFESSHVGSFWRIGHLRESDTLNHPITTNNVSSSIAVFGPYTLRSYGTWTADLLFEQSIDGGTTWDTVQKIVGKSDQNLEVKGTADVESLMRVTVLNFTSATAGRATIESADAIIYGIVEITAVGSGGSASATVLTAYPLYAVTATALWSEGAWSAFRGYPRSCTLHEQRLVFGGTDFQPSVIFGSVIDDFENFERGTDDDMAYVFQLAGLELNAIQWMASLKALLVGTTGSEWRVIGDELGGTITPTRVSARQFSYLGSEYVQAEATGEAVLFIERHARALREVRPDGDSFVVTDLLLLAEHLTRDGYIVQLAWQRDARILWCVTSDGRLIAATYNREQSVLGWHRHVTDGDFRSVATIYGDTAATDEVWFVIERTINSAQVFYVERLNPTVWEDREDYYGVDCGLSYSGSPFGSFAGLDHLAGQTVDALVDGVVYQGLEVDQHGEVNLPTGVDGSVVHIGLPYTSLLSPFRLDADTQLGVHLGKSKRIDHLSLRIYRSAGVEYDFGASALNLKTKDGQVATGLFGDPEAEDFGLAPMTGNQADPRLTIRQSQPLPLTVLALSVGYAVSQSGPGSK